MGVCVCVCVCVYEGGGVGGVAGGENESELVTGWAAVNPVHMAVLQPAALRSREIIEKKICF